MNDDGHKGRARACSALMIAGQVICEQIREREAKGSIYTITSHFLHVTSENCWLDLQHKYFCAIFAFCVEGSGTRKVPWAARNGL
jgi:hypothetical protein